MSDVVKEIAEDARRLGVRPNSALLVHSSFRSLGRSGLTPQDVIDGLRLALGDHGTLMFPALSYLHCGPAHSLTFDVRNTPSNVGALPEYFRTSVPGVKRSLCPTHSCCAIGDLQETLLGGHHLDDTPAGKHSPFYRLMEQDGSVLFLGCGTNCNTSMHAVEELTRPDYLFEDCYTYTMIREDGTSYQQRCFAHDFRGVKQAYSRMEALLDGKELQVGNILQANCHLMRCVPMWKKANEKYREQPHYFVITQ